MVAHINPTVRKRRLGAELRRLRKVSGLTSREVAERLLISQPSISRLENGHRAISPRDIRDLCALYEVADQQVVDALLDMARESGQRGWWEAYGDVPANVYIGLEADAASIHAYEPMVIPGLLQTPAYAQAVIDETVPLLTTEQAAMRLKVRLRRQHRVYDPARPLRLWVVLDESVVRRTVGSADIMREQLEHLNVLGAEPHITVQVLPYTVGAHPGIAGQFSILKFADRPEAGVVYLEGSISDLYLEKRADLQHHDAMFIHLQSRALSPDSTLHFIADAIKAYTGADTSPLGRGEEAHGFSATTDLDMMKVEERGEAR
ncbi:helix-turn-helix transcriptional regulator [Streptomyces sp. MS2.AVA.5]|uniref:Helix-turn-helix transcriptional regulator n=1 Tax=Streptomyces achmelvichensis TaxID=3134111 RepID=A0ACC6PME8_9ACTN